MKGIMTYKPPERASPVVAFLDGLEPKFREKLILQILQLSKTPRSGLKEPHYKHFSIERYRDLYELREKGKMMVRIIFSFCPGGEVVLLYAFVKRQKRDTMQALEVPTDTVVQNLNGIQQVVKTYTWPPTLILRT